MKRAIPAAFLTVTLILNEGGTAQAQKDTGPASSAPPIQSANTESADAFIKRVHQSISQQPSGLEKRHLKPLKRLMLRHLISYQSIWFGLNLM
jgi:hypothetical protein